MALDEKSIFNEARRMGDAAARRAYLQHACGGDEALFRRIEALLQVMSDEPGFLESPAAGLTEPPPPSATGRPGLMIGRYQLVELLGEGGMGEVWKAEQQAPVRRDVALKLIRAGKDSRQVIARFEAERQALALMDHPNIAKVLDAGQCEPVATGGLGLPYFVMELVQGQSLTRYCDEQRLSPRARLELFIHVCNAIQHAHQKGIIHRDIKPNNVLIATVDGRPVPKVIDFGVAKAIDVNLTDISLETNFGTVVGTPQYMSPEQADAKQSDVDTRSDIYSLGVLLYELLTGSPPFDKQTLADAGIVEMLRIIREVEPPTPSTKLSSADELPSIAANRNIEPKQLTSLMRGDLDWIVMRSLEKDRNRRYATANGLARDIERYLHDEPVEAGPPGAGYRIGKFARRHRKALAAAALFAATLMAATVISIMLASWAVRERDRAEAQERLADSNYKKAREAVDQMLTHVAETKLLNLPHMEPVRRDLLQDALRFYQEFLKERGDDPVARRETAKAQNLLGRILAQLGQPAQAEELYQKALAMLEQLLAESPDDPAVQWDLASVSNDLGVFYQTTQRLPQAVAAIARSVTLREQIQRRQPTDAKNRWLLAGSLNNFVVYYRHLGQLDEAEAAFLKAKALLESLLADDANNYDYLTWLALCHQNVALVHGARNHHAESAAANLIALKLFEQLSRVRPDDVDNQKALARIHNNLGLHYSRIGQHAQAEAAYQQSLAAHEAILRDHPRVVSFAVDVGAACGNLANHVRNNRSPEDSLPLYDRTMSVLEPALKQDATDAYARMYLFDCYLGHGLAMRLLKRDEEAAKDWRRAVDVSAGQAHINMRVYRVTPLARLGEHAQVAKEIETLVAEGRIQGPNLSIFATALAISAAAAANDGLLSPAERATLADKYGSRAVELYRKAQAAGYFKDPDRLTRLKENKDLDAIRSRPDFQNLIAELESGPKAKP